tara:strand:+ start:73 stop:408 length:336 start_codon:yes stop_codon:yes gene_type:complete
MRKTHHGSNEGNTMNTTITTRHAAHVPGYMADEIREYAYQLRTVRGGAVKATPGWDDGWKNALYFYRGVEVTLNRSASAGCWCRWRVRGIAAEATLGACLAAIDAAYDDRS